jgi:hypothetical protein
MYVTKPNKKEATLIVLNRYWVNMIKNQRKSLRRRTVREGVGYVRT